MATNTPDDENDERTFIYTQPIFPAGYAAGTKDKAAIMQSAGPEVERQVQLTGKDKFEYMLLYCLRLLEQAQGNICAFYLDDFPDCDEFNMRILQQLIGRSGYTTSDFLEPPNKNYKGFWAWLKK